MYCATSFCEREHSSKRERMYFERLWCALVPPVIWRRRAGASPFGRCLGGVARRFIGAKIRRGPLALLPRGRVSPPHGQVSSRPTALAPAPVRGSTRAPSG